MGNEFTGFEDNAPTLTLEPDLGEPKAEIAAEPEAEAVKKEMEQTVLSPEEQQMVDSFAKKIDIENTNQILQYGAGTQKKMADFSEAALENVRTKDLGEVGDMLSSVVTELKSFDAAEEQEKELRPELSNHVENFEQYDTVILGFPNWWGDLPMPVYSFLEEYDFAGKTIIPFVTHGGSGFSATTDTISQLQPDAQVSDNTLSLSREDVADAEDEVKKWAQGLGLQ